MTSVYSELSLRALEFQTCFFPNASTTGLGTSLQPAANPSTLLPKISRPEGWHLSLKPTSSQAMWLPRMEKMSSIFLLNNRWWFFGHA
jgi:hypothetical protein